MEHRENPIRIKEQYIEDFVDPYLTNVASVEGPSVVVQSQSGKEIVIGPNEKGDGVIAREV